MDHNHRLGRTRTHKDMIASHSSDFGNVLQGDKRERGQVHGFGVRSGWMIMSAFLERRKVLRWCDILLAPLVVAGCYQSPANPEPLRQPTVVQSSPSTTFRESLAFFARQGVSLLDADTVVGTIESQPTPIPDDGGADTWADCGSYLVEVISPSMVTYRVTVHGASSTSSIKVLAHFTGTRGHGAFREPVDCLSTDVREREIESAVRSAAERPR